MNTMFFKTNFIVFSLPQVLRSVLELGDSVLWWLAG